MKKLDSVINTYKEAFRENGDSTLSVLTPKGRQDLRFGTLLSHFPKTEPGTIMDFGCGLAFLKAYIDQQGLPFQYSGCDMVDDFIRHNSTKYPGSEFILLNGKDLFSGSYDYIVSSGVFNMLYTESAESHEKIVFDTLKGLFEKCDKVLSVDFMTDTVDFIQEGAYHQNLGNLLDFVRQHLSKRFIVDHSYMPYEYTISIFKDETIIRPDNIYKA